MQKASNQTIYDLIDLIAPFDSQADFDNSGFLLGDPGAPLSAVYVALDCDAAAMSEAKRLGAQLIVSHHPLLFHPVKELRHDHHDGALISQILREGLSLISAHTNLDQSPLSAARVIAEGLGMKNLRHGDPYIVMGELPEAMEPSQLGEKLSDMLGVGIRSFGKGNIRTLAIAGGAYCEGYHAAMAAGAQALLTGEVRQHNAVAAMDQGFVILDAGHAASEWPMMERLSRYLQKQLDDLRYSVRVFVSGRPGYPATHLARR